MNSNSVPTVFVVDDDPSVRRAMARLVQSVGLQVETFASAQEFLTAYGHERPGVLVLDIRMPQMSGLELQQLMAEKGIILPIVFITGHGDVPMSVQAMKAGALDFIQKPFRDHDLLQAVQRGIAKDAELRQARSRKADALARVAQLTAREREVFELVTSGKMNKEIAALLGISEKTVKVHRGQVMEKMRAESLAELVLLAQAAGVTAPKVTVPQGPRFPVRQ